MFNLRKCRVGMVGLGYVGLPMAVEFGKHFETFGFDVNPERIRELRAARDSTREASPKDLRSASRLLMTTRLLNLKPCGVMVVTVPTPIDEYKRPELTPLIRASESIGEVFTNGDVVVYESTVYLGCTEGACVPILERVSGLRLIVISLSVTARSASIPVTRNIAWTRSARSPPALRGPRRPSSTNSTAP
jgi:UDP-N-acetyl-D-galactosamine dehydrogenase